MIIANDRSWCIVTNTKCATHSLMQALTTTQHIFREQKHDYDVHEVPNLAEDAVVYFTVRNPYHRFMSMWHHHNTKWSAPGRPLWHEMEPGNIVSFCECFF